MPTLHTPIFDCLDAELRGLVAVPLSIDGRLIEGLPDRPIDVGELRSMLLHPSTGYATRDAALAHIAIQAKTDERWHSVLIAMVLPALRSVVSSLARTAGAAQADLEAEVVAGATAAAMAIGEGSTQIASSIRWAAYRSGLRAIKAAEASGYVPNTTHDGCPPSQPWGHPDLILDKAVAENVISRPDAELIATTRLEGTSVAEAARQNSATYIATQRRRHRAEARLVAWIAQR